MLSVQFEKREEQPCWSVNFHKVAGTNGTKLHKALQLRHKAGDEPTILVNNIYPKDV